MNFKIINVPDVHIEVCLHRDTNEEGKEVVLITAFVVNNVGVELIVERCVQFSDAETARFFVNDYSVNTAREFIMLCIDEEGIRVGCDFNKKLYKMPAYQSL